MVPKKEEEIPSARLILQRSKSKTAWDAGKSISFAGLLDLRSHSMEITRWPLAPII